MHNSRIQYYVSRFQSIYNGKPWYGESFDKKLYDITNEQAFRKPGEGLHTIAELVHHIVYWRTPLIKRLEGDSTFVASMESDDNWMSMERLQSLGWPAIRQHFDASQENLIALLSDQPDSFLDEKFSERYSNEELVQGIIDHDIYHLGQIALIRKMVTT